jgi:hypothetical protein
MLFFRGASHFVLRCLALEITSSLLSHLFHTSTGAKVSSIKLKATENESKDKIVSIHCIECKRSTRHRVSVYKIGMTRRLEPMERIDELGDASVPFCFDVHAMVFSDNAPAIEAKLHERFAAGRLNKVNGRKEFFRADIAEIESVIRANYDAVVEVMHEAVAEQFRESLRMVLPKPAIQQVERAVARADV